MTKKYEVEFSDTQFFTVEADHFSTDSHNSQFIIFRKKTGALTQLGYDVYEDVAAIHSGLVKKVRMLKND